MRRWVLIAGGAVALGAAASCEPSLSLDELLDGAPCRAEGQRCLPGYDCRKVDDREICVPKGSSIGQSGNGGDGGGSGTDAGGGGVTGGSGGTVGSGGTGTGGSDQGGAGGDAGFGGSTAQGGSDVPDAALGDGCVPGPLYRDRDADGYGSDAPADIEFGCELAGYVRVGGDCYDESRGTGDSPELAHPGQTQFLYQLLIDTTKPNNQSYDFDCDGVEEPDPNMPGPPTCPPDLLGGLMCNASGYAETGRTGTGISGLCGSEVIAFCEPQGIGQCGANFRPIEGNELPVGCR